MSQSLAIAKEKIVVSVWGKVKSFSMVAGKSLSRKLKDEPGVA